MQTKLPWLCATLLGAIGWLAGYSMNDRSPGGGAKFVLTPDTSKTPDAPPTESGAMAAMKDFEKSATALLEDENELRRSHRLYQLIEQVSAAQMPGAIDVALRLDRDKGREFSRGLIARWMELDPRAAAQYAIAVAKEGRSSSLRAEVFRIWAEKDFDGATQFALALGPGNERQKSLGELAITLAKTEPARALKFFDENLDVGKIIDGQASYLAGIVGIWAQKDFVAAAQYAATIKNAVVRADALMHINVSASRNMSQSPQEILRWAKDIPDQSFKETITREPLQDWSRTDPQAVIEFASTLRPGEMKKTAMRRAVYEWAQRDAAAATEYVKSLPESDTRAAAITGLIWQVGKDAPAAIALANLLPEGNERTDTFRRIGESWESKDPKEAAAYFLQNPSADDNAALAGVLSRWTQSDPQGVLAWADALPDGPEKSRAEASALRQMAANDPMKAGALAMKLTGGAQSSAVAGVASTWAEHDPVAASAWAAGLPEGDARANAFSSIIARASTTDEAAVKLLGTLPDGRSRDEALRTYSNRVAWNDPQGAIKWASSVSDEISRRNALENIARNWMKKDKAAASAWVESTDLLPENTRQHLLGKAGK